MADVTAEVLEALLVAAKAQKEITSSIRTTQNLQIDCLSKQDSSLTKIVELVPLITTRLENITTALLIQNERLERLERVIQTLQ